MTQFYILVEGINIYANIFDTNQLSVIRGGSFFLKQAIDHIEKTFEKEITPLSTGASSGLFLVKECFNAAQLTKDIAKELNQPNTGYSLFTFIVENCSAENLLQAKEQLLAQLRTRQMHSLTVAPDISDQNIIELNQPDGLEGRRIAADHPEITIQKKTHKLSHSVFKRWENGKDLKQNYYFQEKNIRDAEQLDFLKQYSFSQHFEDLADNPDYSKLNGKIAVIYMDGNSFSSKQKQILQTAQEKQENLIDTQIKFDRAIQNNRSTFLLNLLLKITDKNPDSGFNNALQKNKKTLRFETLLWGGDEMLFVLPAWLGFEFLQYFFDETKDWKIDEQQLTHAAGMVFCSAKTPIRNIRNIAQSLAETVKVVKPKDAPNGKSGRDQNAWSYMILESIDYPTNNDIEDFNTKHYGQFLSKPPLIPAAINWNALKSSLDSLFNQGLLPRRQLYRIVQEIATIDTQTKEATLDWEKINHPITEGLTGQEKQEIRLLQVSNDKESLSKALSTISQTLFSLDINDPKQRIWLWIYLYELWSYISPQPDRKIEKETR